MTMWFILTITLLCHTSFALNPDWQIYQYGHRAWKMEDGFPGTTINALAQGKDGYLWVGTDSGLYRFDGIRFTPWKPPDGTRLPNMTLSLLADRDGSLWIGTSDGLAHWDHDHLTRYKKNAVYSILQDADGTVWFVQAQLSDAAHDVLCSVAHSTITCFGTKDGFPSLELFLAPSRDSSGNLWLGGPDSIVAWKTGSPKIYVPDSLKNNRQQGGVASLAIDIDGTLLVGIGKEGPGLGLQRFHDGRWTTVTVPGFDGSKHKVSQVFLDQNQSLWIGTSGEGLYRLRRGRVENFDSRDGLSGDRVLSIHEDNEGSLWVGTNGGLDQLRDLPVQTFSKERYPTTERYIRFVERFAQHFHSSPDRLGRQHNWGVPGPTLHRAEVIARNSDQPSVRPAVFLHPDTGEALELALRHQ